MKSSKSFSVGARLASFSHALSGLADMLTTEPNAWIHATATLIVLALSWWLRIPEEAFACTVIAIVAVWMAEAFNTVLELVVDMVAGGKFSAPAKRAKDIAAAAVLITTLGAIAIGVVVLGPRLYSRLLMLFF